MGCSTQSSVLRASPASVSQPSLARSLVFVDLSWAGGAQVLIYFAEWSAMDLKEVSMQEMHSDGLL